MSKYMNRELQVEELIMFIEKCKCMSIMEKKEIYKRIFIFSEVFCRSVGDEARKALIELEEIGFIINDEWIILKTIVLGIVGDYTFNQTILNNWESFVEGVQYLINGERVYELLLSDEDRHKAEDYAIKRVGEDLENLLID